MILCIWTVRRISTTARHAYLKKVARKFGHTYGHAMKADDDAFVSIPGIFLKMSLLIIVLVEVIRAQKEEK